MNENLSLRIGKYLESLKLNPEKEPENDGPAVLTRPATADDEIHRLFWDFSTSPVFVTLVVEGKDLFVHKDILAAASPVFKDMMNSEEFLEKKKMVKIDLPEKKYEDMQEMLNLLYPFKLQVVDAEKIENLLNLSKEFDIKAIRDKCEKFLLTKDCSMDLLIVAQEYGLKTLLKKCIDYFGTQLLFDVQKDEDISKENAIAIKQQQLILFQTSYKSMEELTMPDAALLLTCKGNRNGTHVYQFNKPDYKPIDDCKCASCAAARILNCVDEQKKKLAIDA